MRRVTGRRAADRLLHESERKYRELVESVNCIILRWSRDGRVTFMNEFGQQFFGYRAEEIVGRHVVGTIVPPSETGGRDLSRLMEEILADPAAFEHNVNENVRRSGERVWVEWTNRIVRDARGAIAEILSVGTDVTLRKAAEESLRRSQAQLSLVLGNVSDPVFAIGVGEDGINRFAWVNSRFLETSGLAEAQVVGVPVADVIPRSSHTRTFRKYHEAIQTRRAVHWEEVARYPAGEKFVHVTVVPVFDAAGTCRQLIGMVHDITEQKRAEHAIRELNAGLERRVEERTAALNEETAKLLRANQQLAAIFRAAGAGIVVCRDRLVLQCNARLEEMFGYAPGELIGKPTRLWHFDDAGYAMGDTPVNEQIGRGETHRRVQRLKRKDGSGFWALIHARALDLEDPSKGLVGVIEDITAERQNAEDLRKAKEAAESADRLKSVFLATMSHELRTPLNSIIGFAGILLQGLAGPLNDEQKKQLGMVKDSSDHLLSLINDVLDISKIEAGQLRVAFEPFDLREAVHRVIRLAGPLAAKKGLALETALAPGIGTFTGDRRRVEQILINLLSNAVKFTERGRVRLECAPGERGGVSIRVADTGIGIRKEDIAGLFMPFRQIDTGITRLYEGTGLGLSICKRLLDLMGGSIRVESEPGRGSVFIVEIPARGAAA